MSFGKSASHRIATLLSPPVEHCSFCYKSAAAERSPCTLRAAKRFNKFNLETETGHSLEVCFFSRAEAQVEVYDLGFANVPNCALQRGSTFNVFSAELGKPQPLCNPLKEPLCSPAKLPIQNQHLKRHRT